MANNDIATTRLAAAMRHARTLPDGRHALRFDPGEPGSYDPTPDLDELQIDYEVALLRSKTTDQAWFEARFTGEP